VSITRDKSYRVLKYSYSLNALPVNNDPLRRRYKDNAFRIKIYASLLSHQVGSVQAVKKAKIRMTVPITTRAMSMM